MSMPLKPQQAQQQQQQLTITYDQRLTILRALAVYTTYCENNVKLMQGCPSSKQLQLWAKEDLQEAIHDRDAAMELTAYILHTREGLLKPAFAEINNQTQSGTESNK